MQVPGSVQLRGDRTSTMQGLNTDHSRQRLPGRGETSHTCRVYRASRQQWTTSWVRCSVTILTDAPPSSPSTVSEV
ncbi:hypothetical protein NP493_6680g00001 [Ridgeia piscesae]|uniref:Uncharacterized protein n=1 Tax=Ridgeia piscesae TaxID=27915 RepID=A0AAD9IQK6_RIDPI|nr:hypothetical protein NP493_6680g00001 [Ridgeia piscesae]